MTEKITNHNPALLEKVECSAMEVAEYLLSLDPKREYFTLTKLKWGAKSPIQGNFRLNKILHMCQIFHCIKYGEPLFKERMLAFQHGAIIFEIYTNFYRLHGSSKKKTFLNSEKKDFIKKNFHYFRKSDDLTLRDFSHEDPAWELGKKEEIKLMPLNEELIKTYKKEFTYTLKEFTA